MCNDQKMLKQQLKNSKNAKYEIGNFYEQHGLPPIAPSKQKRDKKYDKVHKDYKYKRYKIRFTKPNDFYAKKKIVYKKKDKQKPGKLKNKLNMLNINDSDKEDLIQILKS